MSAGARAPVDLRLAPAALATWLVCWWAVAAGTHVVVLAALVAPVAGAVVVGLVAAIPLLPARRGRRTRRPRPAALAPPAALAVGAAAVALAACAVQLAVRDRADLGDLAAAGRVVTVEATVRDDPVPLRSTWGEGVVLASLDVTTVDDGTRAWRAAAPVLVRGDPGWSDVAVGARVVVTGRLRPADPGSARWRSSCPCGRRTSARPRTARWPAPTTCGPRSWT
ncbi:hypothetical protein GCM10025864_32670 [Luteimicrobium album]|uniref:DUF4131 domain-containing protein n=1 Tax=Luteimicrobium album TaxID=1054550 RepID=A0ABQ6I6B9_9MICO|nr:hypothetical protein [Luteimicrobium album]GMA25508.1 hypothetical protein GCM10025864_32670 [Luteimicrobium album]